MAPVRVLKVGHSQELGCQRGCQSIKTAARISNGRSQFELDFEVSPLGLEPRTG